MRHTLLSISLIAVFVSCGPQSATTITLSTTKTMNYTLDFCGKKKIQNPTEADIWRAILALDTNRGDDFLVLGPTHMTYIQTSGDQKVGFVLEYQDMDVSHHYRAKGNFTVAEVVKALVSYSAGSDDWKTMAEWELIRW